MSWGRKHLRQEKRNGIVDRSGWQRLTRTADNGLEKTRLRFSRCANRDVAALKQAKSCP